MQTLSVHAVANGPHSPTSPDGHALHAWSAIAPLMASENVLVSVPMNRPMPRLATWQPKLPVSATSSLVSCETTTSPTSMRVVDAIASWRKLIGMSSLMSGLAPGIVSIFTPQLPTSGTVTGMSICERTRARTVTSRRDAPCAGRSSIRGRSPGCAARSITIGPHGDCGLPPGQHTGVEPPQLAGTSKVSPMPPSSPPSSAAGSAATVASPDWLIRTWPALGVRAADGNPPGIGSRLEQPPPHPDDAATAASNKVAR